MIPFSIFLASKYLRPERSFLSVVTVISVMGVLLGVAILVVVISVMSGFDDMWREKILSFKPHLTVSSPYGVIEGEEELCRRLDRLEGIQGVAPVVQTLVLIQSGGMASAPIVIGVDPDRATEVSQVHKCIVEGTFSLEEKGVVIGIDLAN